MLMFTKSEVINYMNIQECDILNALTQTSCDTQRALAHATGHSLGVVNRCVKSLTAEGYLTQELALTEKARQLHAARAPKNAIILAAGFGMRMVPINLETPKGLVTVHGEPLIERLIGQLQAVGIQKIYVVVGFMKEQYEYLIDEYGVELLITAEYSTKNNLHSLALALPYLSNSYVIPCDLWCAENPFRRQELYSWYMVSEASHVDGAVRANRKLELVPTRDHTGGNKMLGIAYLLEPEAAIVRSRIESLRSDPRNDGAFWEEALWNKDKLLLHARIVPADAVVEINTYEQLRDLDGNSDHLKSEALDVIAQALDAPLSEITDITVLKKGMTNRSFCFTCRGKTYIMRIPGEGTDQLIDRKQEAAVYQVIAPRGLCDNVAYINPDNGYKITEFLSPARVCDPENPEDVQKCMAKLRDFHNQRLTVEHEFDLFGHIEFYESLWNGAPSVYKDYQTTKANVLKLRAYIDAHAEEKCLTHVDAVPDNFLFVQNPDGSESIRLIDWEYAGMQDPHMDIAMFCIYSLYDRPQVDALIDVYFEGNCSNATRIKIYCYIAACGLLWSNWCEYKRHLGVEFGEYSLRQYRFAKDYCKIVLNMLEGA